mmetsp:Transcript_115254/g.200619  ORF Transcript_115254/g.200619 Transcript_115254/m.200619 type:complete len:98 (+) Transcript_115254:63-356(+)
MGVKRSMVWVAKQVLIRPSPFGVSHGSPKKINGHWGSLNRRRHIQKHWKQWEQNQRQIASIIGLGSFTSACTVRKCDWITAQYKAQGIKKSVSFVWQ